MDSDDLPSTASADAAPASESRRPSRWRRFATKRFLVASLALHLLFGFGAASWVTHHGSPDPEKSRGFMLQMPASQAATQAVEHRVKVAERRNLMSAPPAPRRVLSQRPATVALPAVPTLPDAPPMSPAFMAGGGGQSPGGGFGLPRGAGMGGGGAAITRFIGGLRITAQKLGVALDVSGSVREYQQAMHAHVASVFKGSEVTEITSAGFYRVQPPRASIGSAVLGFLNSPQRFDAIYVFSDFGETHGKIPTGHEDLWPEVQRLVREKKTRLYLHILRKFDKQGNLNPALDAVVQLARSTGGSVQIGPMTQVAAGDNVTSANPL